MPPEEAGPAIDGLSGEHDVLWPRDRWPAMVLSPGLRPGARGGHGPVRYHVEEYVPGRRVSFRFDGAGLTAGLDGRHVFELVPRRHHVILRHVVDAECDVKTWLKWRILIGPLHDALLEDALDRFASALPGQPPRPARWSPWVRFLRWAMAKRRKREEARGALRA